MKQFKKFLFVLLFALVSVFGLSACKKKDEVIKIGILQLATHSALTAAKDGFIEALNEAGFVDGENIEITVKNPEGDEATLVTYATELVRNSDLVLGIATKAATHLQSARDTEQVDCPILFTAVTDPVSASLVTALDQTDDNITGTTDMNPVADQIDLIKEILPDIKKVGIIYNIDEVNSQVQADLAKVEAEKEGIEIIIKTVSQASEISTTTAALIEDGAEALYLPTDSLIASNMPAITSVCEEKDILTVCGESGMLEGGGSITYSISYSTLGKLTGEMAAEILNGKNVSDVNVTTVDISGLELVVNEESFAAINIAIPDSIKEKLNK